jgi:hypothetical protein
MPQSTRNAGQEDTIFIIVTNRVLEEEERRHSQHKDSRPLPKTPPNMPLPFSLVCGVCTVLPNHHAPLKKYHRFFIGRTVGTTVIAPSG